MVSKYGKTFTNRVCFSRGVDFDGIYLTASGVAKFQQILSYKGGAFSVGISGAGHTGFIYYARIGEVTKNGVKKSIGYYYTLEFNTSGAKKKGDTTTGGKLAFDRRIIGQSWGKRIGNRTDVWIGDTNNCNGGIWAPNGLGNDNTFTFGSSITFSKQFD